MAKRKTHEQYIDEMRIKQPNIEVLSKYVNSRSIIKYRCKIDGHEDERRADNLLTMGCHVCSGFTKTHEQFIKQLKKINPNIEVLEKYKGAREKIKVRCLLDNNEWYVAPYTLLSGYGCPECDIRNKRKAHEDFIKEMKIINPNIEILGEYINNDTPIRCRCLICNNEWKTRPHILSENHGCPQCANNKSKERWLGKNNPRYNPNLTDEEKEENRRDAQRKEWAKEVKKKDNYTCQCCGSNKSGTLRSHHLYSYDKYRCLRYVIENGVVLCEDCHKEFHHIYGYGNNTKEQFEEFLKNKSKNNNDNEVA